MMKFRTLVALSAVSALAACSGHPAAACACRRPAYLRRRRQISLDQWLFRQGYEAMYFTFGKMHLKAAEHHWIRPPQSRRRAMSTSPSTSQTRSPSSSGRATDQRDQYLDRQRSSTPLGFWTINWKRPMYRSKKYDNAAMPFMQNIDDKGIAIHGGVTPGYPASRLHPPANGLRQSSSTAAKPGNKVVIEG
jgi:hypothetical protein